MLLRLALAGFLAVAAVPVSAQPFEFVALGDMPFLAPATVCAVAQAVTAGSYTPAMRARRVACGLSLHSKVTYGS